MLAITTELQSFYEWVLLFSFSTNYNFLPPTSARVDFKLLDAVHEAAEEVGTLVLERIRGRGLSEPLRAERGHFLGHPVVHHHRFVSQDYYRLICWFGLTKEKKRVHNMSVAKKRINKKTTMKRFITWEKYSRAAKPRTCGRVPSCCSAKIHNMGASQTTSLLEQQKAKQIF
jgi:hypothetical protein